MVGITKEHPIVRSQALVESISFEVIGVNDCKTFVKGKKKSNNIEYYDLY